MSKITFRADDELVDAVEALDASKSEVMREALRAYLGGTTATPDAVGHSPLEESLDDIVTRRVEQVLDDRLDDVGATGREVAIHLTVDEPTSVEDGTARAGAVGEHASTSDTETARPTAASPHQCEQCGNELDSDHVYCPNCGEHAAQAYQCECGEPLDAAWSFCPDCGRRTASVEFLER